MDREKAKQLLELCRPGHQGDRQDPALAEAFARLDSDPELKAWFDEQQALDTRISDQLRRVKTPADLKSSILAGMHLHASNRGGSANGNSPENTTPFPEQPQQNRPRPRWITPWIGIAALFLVALVVLNLPSESPAPAYTRAGIPPVIQFLSSEIDALNPSKFDKRDPSAENLRHFLASTQSPSPQSLPAMLENVPTIGCLTFQFEGTPLSMICFKDGAVYHLITADKASFPGDLPEIPQIFEIQNKAFRLWTEGEQVKILTIHGSKNDFPEFI
jgi:hypothetical protein